MALKVTPPFEHGGEQFDMLHMKVSSHRAAETDEAPLDCNAGFRAYKKNGDKRQFAPTDMIPPIRISVVDLEKKAIQFAQAGFPEKAQVISNAMTEYQKALALFIEDEHVNLTVEVV